MKQLESIILTEINNGIFVSTPSELINIYIDGSLPFLDNIKKTIKENYGTWLIENLSKIKNYKKIKIGSFDNLTNKIGSGKYANVYLYNNYAIKSIEHRFYNHLPRLDGEIEYKILKILLNKIILSLYSPNIVIVQQYLASSEKKIDYIVLERLDKTFWNYINFNPNNTAVKAIILQTLFVLVILQKKLPGFRHNDLKIDNILLDQSKRKHDIFLQYHDNYWKISKNIPISKIADFDYACIPGQVQNPKIGTKHSKSFGCDNEKNKIYDLHIFLNSLYHYKNKLDPEIVLWIENNIPKELLGTDNKYIKYGRLKNPKCWQKKIKEPIELLKDEFFSEFKTKKPKKKRTWGLKC